MTAAVILGASIGGATLMAVWDRRDRISRSLAWTIALGVILGDIVLAVVA